MGTQEESSIAVINRIKPVLYNAWKWFFIAKIFSVLILADLCKHRGSAKVMKKTP
jgi:hypothetical protein